MTLTVPKIVYPSGGGTTLTFAFPPRNLPYKTYEAVRHDNVASSGAVERIYERRDEFLPIFMEYVRIGSDVAAWDTFVQYALAGGSFDYYPDSTVGTSDVYILADTNWNAAFKQLGMHTFSLKLRKATSDTGIGGGFHGESLTLIPSYTYAGLPASAAAGSLARVSDGPGGIWMYSGAQWVRVGKGVNVKDAPFNALGDGTTDDTAAFVAASAYGQIYVPAGIYITEDFDLPSDCTISGDGIGQSIIRAKPSAGLDYLVHVPNTSSNVTIRDLTIDGNRAAGGLVNAFSGALYISGNNVSVLDCEITGGTFSGIFVGDTAIVVTDTRISRCYIHDNGGVVDSSGNGVGVLSGGNGSGFSAPKNLSITDCDIEYNHNTVTKPNDSSGINITVNGCVVVGNRFTDNFNVGGAQLVVNAQPDQSGSIYAVVNDNHILSTTTFGTPTDRTEGIEIQGRNFTVTGNVIKVLNIDASGIDIGGTATDASAYGVISGNRVDCAGGNGINLDSAGVSAPVSDIVIQGNIVTGADNGVAVNSLCTNINVIGNNFQGCSQAIAGTLSTTVYLFGNVPFISAGRIHSGAVSIASAAHFTMGNANTAEVTGTTDIELISVDGWENGDIITLYFTNTMLVKHDQVASGNFKSIKLDGGADFAATQFDCLQLLFNSVGWEQVNAHNP